ncbi:hypothetical protein BC941DRAFT_445946 [Chlamydoabsidia padenii]|nr:hypothetical protein BC941DRAFT_445946 [Chlamydoabsidia padenii]
MGLQTSKLDGPRNQSKYPPSTLNPLNGKSNGGGGGGRLEYGSLLPQGIYPSSTCDYNVKAVRKFIKEGLLAPFFIGLNEQPDRTEHKESCSLNAPKESDNNNSNNNTAYLMRNKIKDRLLLLRSSSTCRKTDQLLYNRTIECPICLLIYPDCLNYTRCCDKPICTDCFLQLRRSDESPLVPAACPFCVQPNLGVIHFPPFWSQHYMNFKKQRMDLFVLWDYEMDDGRKRRSKKLGPNDRNVVLVDQIRPNWQDQFNLKKLTPTRQLNSDQLLLQQGRHRRRFSGSLSGTGTTRRIIVRPAMQPSLTSRTM